MEATERKLNPGCCWAVPGRDGGLPDREAGGEQVSAQDSSNSCDFWLLGTFCRVERIEALELVGASFANDKDNYDVGMAYRSREQYHFEYIDSLQVSWSMS